MSRRIRIQLSIMMFLQFFIWGTWYVTMTTYLGGLGFKGSEIGGAYSTVNLGAIIAPLIVGMIADRFFDAQKVLGVLNLMGAGLLYMASTITASDPFYWTMLMYSICYMPTLAIVNAIAFYQMESPEKEFPSIRVLGTIGWIAAGLVIGSILKAENSSLQFVAGAAASLITGIFAFTLPKTPPQAKGEKVNIGKLLGIDALRLMKDRSFAILIISSLLISIPLSFYYAFANNFLNEEGMTHTATKMAFLGQGSEIIFMLLMPFFFVRLGVKKMILIGMLCWVARYLLFAFGNNGELIFMFYLGIILHGLCYDFFFVTGQIYVDNAAPEEVRSSAQGLISIVTYGIGMYIGSIISGFVVEHFESVGADGSTVHQWAEIWLVPAALAAIVMVAFAIFFRDNKRTASPAVGEV